MTGFGPFPRALLAALLLVVFTALGTTPVAMASPPPPTSIPGDDLTDPIEDVTDAVDDAVDTVEDTVEEVTPQPVEDVTDPVVDAVEDTVEDVEDVTDPVVDAVEGVAEPVEGVVDTVTDTVTGTVGDGSPSAGDPVGGGAGFGQGGDSRPGRPTAGSGVTGAGGPAGGDAGDGSEADPLGGTGSHVTSFEVGPAGASTQGADSGVLENIATTITEIARRLAFPLALALVVLAFLGVQGQLDRKDPKLALAPVDSLQEYMSFR